MRARVADKPPDCVLQRPTSPLCRKRTAKWGMKLARCGAPHDAPAATHGRPVPWLRAACHHTVPPVPPCLQGYQYSWCVDPLDGTKEFLKRNGQFTVNIALLEGSRPILGVVAVPVDVSTHRFSLPAVLPVVVACLLFVCKASPAVWVS